jgi:hypothetical protein
VNTPAPPNPVTTAAAQTQSNEATAGYQQNLNQTNQVTPYGSVKYAQTGTAADGAPITTATTTLSPQVQALEDSNIANNTAESGIAGQLAKNAGASLSTPLNLGPSALQNQMNAQSAATLDPYWANMDERNNQNMYDQGLAPGSQGYTAESQNESSQRNQAYDQAWNSNEQIAQNAMLTQYNEPLNALNALQSGSQISQPGIGTTAAAPQTSVAGTNVAGINQTSYADQVAQSNAMMGGLFGLGSAALSAATLPSDRRLKRDISWIGMARNGLALYAYRYVWGGPMRSGHMAQEALELYPEAVVSIGGYLALDYGRLP